LKSEPGDPAPPPDDAKLIQDCLAGDQSAWAALVGKYQRLVYSIPFKYQLPPEEAADVFQGVWIDLYRSLGSLQNAAALRGWLATATGRRCLLHKRRRQREEKMEAVDPRIVDKGADLETVQQEAEQEQIVRDSVAQLPGRCQKLIHMLFQEQPPVPYNEVASRLGLAEGSIGFIRRRCLDKLKRILEDSPR
jgi:RNA polymerase sigma factor (sigma-70 family)